MKWLYLIAVVSLTGCATHPAPLWYKSGATQQDFKSDRYACLQESQQQQGRAVVNAYGGAARTGSVTNEVLFRSCMEARGYELK